MKDVNLAKIWLALRWIFLWMKTTFLKYCWLHRLDRSQDHRCLTDLTYSLEIKPSFKERLENIFLSDTKRRYKILEWVQHIVKTVNVTDFSSSWQDGIVLCTLIEHVSPGFCPRFDLLRPHHRVNNCRLGIKLAQKYLRLSKMSITPEEMALADNNTESKIMQMVQMIKFKDNTTKSFSACKALIRDPTDSMKFGLSGSVVARGAGLKTGIVGRKSKFHILTTPGSDVNINMEICGPRNEKNSETIMSIISPEISGEELQNDSETIHGHKGRYIQDKSGNVFLRQTSLEDDNADIIAFNYQSVGEGRFQVTYIPRNSGLHIITIKSAGKNINGSPFGVKISDFIRSLSPFSKIKPVYFDKIHETNASGIYFKDMIPCGRYPNLKESKLPKDSKQLTVTRKRVVKRIITKNGEEILINESTPSPSMSRQSSVDISDFSEDELVKRLTPAKNSKSPLSTLTPASGNDKVGVKDYMEMIEYGQDPSKPPVTDKDTDENQIQTRDVELKNRECSTIKKHHNIEDGQESCGDKFYERLERRPSEKSDETVDDDLPTLGTCGRKSSFSRSLSDGMLKNKHLREVERSNIDSKSAPKLKTLKSSSLRKACFYVSDKAFSQSFSYGSASENSSSDNHEDGMTSEFQDPKCRHDDNGHSNNTTDIEKHKGIELVDDKRLEKNELTEACIEGKRTLVRSTNDRSTQVKSDEIKLETGWRSQTRHLRRRQYLNGDGGAIGTSIDNKGRNDDKLITLQNLVMQSKQYLYPDEKDSVSVTDTAILSNRGVDGNSRLIHRSERTSRQSTLDTNDSGIDDSLRDLFFSNGHRRIARRSYPCEIALDPRLTRSSTSSMSYDGEDSEVRLTNAYLDKMQDKFSAHSTVFNSHDSVFSISPNNTKETSYSDSEIDCISPGSGRKGLVSARRRKHFSSFHEANKIDKNAPRTRATNILQKVNTADHRIKSAGTSDEEQHPNNATVNELFPQSHEQFSLEATPSHTLNELRLRYHTSCSSDDSYCGFGLSTAERKSFLGNIATFQNLTRNENIGVNSGSDKITPVADVEECNRQDLEVCKITDSPVEQPHHDDYEQSSEVFLDQFTDNNPHLMLGQECDRSPEGGNKVTDGNTSNGVRAYGPGLSLGIVDVKNHFQVYVERPDNGGLTVGVYGPLPHCVVETSINYTGSHIYEITYHVTLPGRYVISVKWAEKNIPNSPFVCQVE